MNVNERFNQALVLLFIVEFPSLVVQFLYNSVQQKLNLRLPLTINKFFEPTDMNAETFFARWKNLGGYKH